MPGQMETFLNIIGEGGVERHIRKVWASAYNGRALTFRLTQNLPLDWAPIGVAVMGLVDAKAAGVVLTVLPSTGDTTKVVIEGNWGLGESVVGGEITPDSFTVDKETLEIIDRKVARKAGMVRRGELGTLYEAMSDDIRDKPCLEDEEIKEIARTAMGVEEHFGLPQDMEWVVDKNLPPGQNIFWVQARPARYVKVEKTDEIDYLIDLMAMLFK
jgi:pyruvate,water dikinase